MEVKRVKLTALKAASYNPKDRTEGKTAVGPLEKSIQEIGLVYPIAVDKNMNIIDGHRRLQAVINLGWTEVPILIVETDDRDKVYADVNSTTNKLTGTQTMSVWLQQPTAVTEHSRRVFEKYQAIYGRAAMERVARAGMAVTVMQDAYKIAKYCDFDEDSKFILRTLNWLIKWRNRMMIRAFIKTGLSAKTLFNAIKANKDLKMEYSV